MDPFDLLLTKINKIQDTMKDAIEEIKTVKSQTGGKKTRKFRLGKRNRSYKKNNYKKK
jgi:hypothetical protein